MRALTHKELAAIFEEIEIKIISSLKRNLEEHLKWEESLDFEWTSWQALKIKALERFRKENKSIMSEYTDIISAETRKMLEEQFQEGADLESAQREEQGFVETTNDNFFEIFDEKIESLIEEVQGKETTVEKAALRMADDVYRQTLIKAEIAVSTGSQTIQQAIGDAVREFAKKGINCIEYRDGRRVNIADYIYMALTTANTRAQLLGAAKVRTELGIDTVWVTSYDACSETCMPWQGNVYIDDVFADFDGEIMGDKGKSKSGKWYTLLSVAVRAGLFHPNCRHSLTTHNENNAVREAPPVDEKKARENYKLEQQQRALERKVRYWKRRLEGETDPELKAGLKKQVKTAQKNLREFIDEHKDVLRRDPWREKIYPETVEKAEKRDIIRGANNNENIDNAKTVFKELGYVSKENQKELIDNFIKKYSSSDVEHMLIIDKNDFAYYVTSNLPDEIKVTNYGDKLVGSYNIHTHPPKYTQFSFSTDIDIPAAFADGSKVMEACDYKYHYRFEIPKNIALDDWEEARFEAKSKVMEILQEKGYSFDMHDYLENYQHILIEETCKILGVNVYKRWKI